MKLYLSFSGLILLTASASAFAQSPQMRKVEVGTTFRSDSGYNLKLIAYSARVSGDKCIANSTSQDTQSGYISKSISEYVATRKDGGVLCTNGKWEGTGQDGQRFSGTQRTDLFIKGGVAYSVPK
jgi:hypothetical protein